MIGINNGDVEMRRRDPSPSRGSNPPGCASPENEEGATSEVNTAGLSPRQNLFWIGPMFQTSKEHIFLD